ncbi:hypothetical protein [Xanthomonas euvesicatoria]|uniref:hypothetical protein n=1 Tax=Xanthomonas euvesicatoria TaxID=456327 RepID=UPI001C4568EF|nr:hypothetical protein [Xanthomonas euvesicatoria]MBV6831155.1 hypothetical protein [Xanthomonas campestris pv. viegasii]
MKKSGGPKMVTDEEPILPTPTKALNYLVDNGQSFYRVTAAQRRVLQVAFAKNGKVVHPRAFDAVHTAVTGPQFGQAAWVDANLSSITLIEIKSTKRDLDDDFGKYFFALTTSELLVAQSLKSQYKIALVDTKKNKHMLLTLQQLLNRARAFYPSWSILL